MATQPAAQPAHRARQYSAPGRHTHARASHGPELLMHLLQVRRVAPVPHRGISCRSASRLCARLQVTMVACGSSQAPMRGGLR